MTVNLMFYLLVDPQFVGSFNIDDAVKGGQVFFFFREIAEEYTESRTKIFSRVAKVCKVSSQFFTKIYAVEKIATQI